MRLLQEQSRKIRTTHTILMLVPDIRAFCVIYIRAVPIVPQTFHASIFDRADAELLEPCKPHLVAENEI